jgi:hypothetical protein
MQRKIDQMYCEELAAPQHTHASLRESAIVASGGAGAQSRAVSRAEK